MKKILFIALFAAISLRGMASHIVGGEIYYDYLGGSNYKITLKVYRDCFNGLAPYDNPASIGVFDNTGVLVTNLLVAFPGSITLPLTITNPCFTPPTNVCVEEAVYDTIVNLPPIPGGYDLSYQRCCRNITINNLVNPQDVGSTYTCHIPDPSMAAVNSSPRYNNFPPIYLCANVPLNFDHSATDPDGDSLVYKLCDPFDGATSAFPMPQPPAAGPYTFVPFLAPYSGTYPMSSSPALNVNLNTGLMTGTPNALGQWVVGVCCEEWRFGQLLSVNKRDFQFNVVTCPPVPVSSIPSQTTFCFGMNVNFLNASVNASTYFWDFGDPFATGDTSNLATPSYTYSQPGVYNVMLIANPGTPCADTGYTTFYIYPLLAPDFVPPTPQCITGNSFNFTCGGSFGGAPGPTTFIWNFGPNATPSTSSAQNPSGIIFSAPGTYAVTLTVSENGCTVSYTDSVRIDPVPVINFNTAPQTGCAPYLALFTDSSFTGANIISILWDFGDGNFSTLENPSHVYYLPGTYTVSLMIVTDNVCADTLFLSVPNMITVNPSPMAGIGAFPTEASIDDPVITFFDQSTGGNNCWFCFGDGNCVNSCTTISYTYTTPGTYTATQIVENMYGCRDTAEITIEILPEFNFFIPNAFTPNGNGLNDVFMPKIRGVKEYEFMIFDRWGQLFFKTSDITQGWDGTYKGTKCQEDVYVWKISFRDLVEMEYQTYVGHVTLIR